MNTPLHLSSTDHDQLRAARDAGPQAREIYRVIAERAARWVDRPDLVGPGDRVDWWHVCWDRLSDVAFLQAVDPEVHREKWLRDQLLGICELSDDAWIGPFFRPRVEPSIGSLETAHVGLGIAAVLNLCPELLTESELDQVREAVRRKGLEPSLRWLQTYDDDGDPVRPINNWYMVLLNGYTTMALATGATDHLAGLAMRVRRAAGLYEADSYGETIQYWGYATRHLSHLYELLTEHIADHDHVAALDPDLDRATLDQEVLAAYAGSIGWITHSMMFTDQSRDWGPGRYTTFVNFGDAAMTARPPAEVLLNIAAYGRDLCPTEAGLARWLFDQTYRDPQLSSSDLSTFGFFNQPGWRSLLTLDAAVEPITPEEAGLPTAQAFSCGSAIIRDRWSEPKTVFAAQAGHDQLATTSHRQLDQATFVLGHRGEVFFSDPGHCCYRLDAYQDAVQSQAHSTWTFADPKTGPIIQRGHRERTRLGTRVGPTVHPDLTGGTHPDLIGGTHPDLIGGTLPELVEGPEDPVVLSVDVADAYGSPIRTARRTWISLLPHIVVVLDEIESDHPVVVHSRFVINNRDNHLRTNIASDSRLVFRRGNAAVKFFQLASTTDAEDSTEPVGRSWSALHDVYDPRPNAVGQGKEGSGEVYTFRTARVGQVHRAVYSIVLADEPEIRGWHVNYDPAADVVEIDRPDRSRVRIRCASGLGFSAQPLSAHRA